MLATNGDTHLGGEDFDQRVMQYFMKLFTKKTGTDISGDNKAVQKLRREVCSWHPCCRRINAPNILAYSKVNKICNFNTTVLLAVSDNTHITA